MINAHCSGSRRSSHHGLSCGSYTLRVVQALASRHPRTSVNQVFSKNWAVPAIRIH